MGDFILLNSNIDKNPSGYVVILFSHAFYPTINFQRELVLTQ